MRSDGAAFLAVAGDLGHEIAVSAIWSHDRCNWMSALPPTASRAPGRPGLGALGPDLYRGTSGVALFLAEVCTRLDDRRLRATALGSIRLALDHADRLHPRVRDGLYAGPVGIAYAAARVGRLLGVEDPLVRARQLLSAWRRDAGRSRSSDVMSGCAGAAVGLIALGPLIEEQWVVAAAARIGDELIRRADSRAAGWSWAAAEGSSMQHLCGYAHGAAGVGHAFAELFSATGEERFRVAAKRAFDYERSWLDTRTGTWPDLRGVARRAGRDAPVSPAYSWCNGAAGIAVSRLRAAELFGSATLGRDADLALAACEQHVTKLVARAPEDFSLCHGAAGAADVLLQASAGRPHVPSALSRQVGRRGIELYAGPRAARFPCGVPLGNTPGLLVGLGGIGMFYLRLSDPRVPSPLLIHDQGLTVGPDAA